MALHRNIWSPDTCGCRVEFSFDDELPGDQRPHTLVKVHRGCVAHQGLADGILYQAITEENQRKNRSLARALVLDPTLADVDGTFDSTKLQWSFGANRILILDLPQSSAVEKNLIRGDLQGQFGASKITVR